MKYIVTIKTVRALRILEQTTAVNTMPAKSFGELFWPEWAGSKKGLQLSAGNFLGKLKKAGFVGWRVDAGERCGYYITSRGRSILCINKHLI